MGGDDGRSAGQSFGDHNAKVFGVGGQDEAIGRAEEFVLFVSKDWTKELNFVGHTKLLSQNTEFGNVGFVARTSYLDFGNVGGIRIGRMSDLTKGFD